MPEPFSVGLLASYALWHVAAHATSAVSEAARTVQNSAAAVAESAEKSQTLFGGKAFALSQLTRLAAECGEAGWDGQEAQPLSSAATRTAESFVRALPHSVPLPEFAPEADGSISLDWIVSKNRLFSLSIGGTNRFAFAWLDGSDKGHGVARFNGQEIPMRVLDGIKALHGHASLRTA